jgi:glycosyltransferase involved in cell wall biosynthesis
MACGTPVIALNRGAVPEIVVDGKTGFVVDSVQAMIEAVSLIDSIDPSDCRSHVLKHFSIKSMAHKYSELYHQLIDSHKISESDSSLSDNYFAEPLHHGTVATL